MNNILFLFLIFFISCSSSENITDNSFLTGSDDSIDTTEHAITGDYPVGTELLAISSVNLRTGPSTSYSILHVIPESATVTLVNGSPTNNYYKIKHGGMAGWSYGKYLTPASDNADGPNNNSQSDSSSSSLSSRSEIIDRSKSAVGFSYWWGHGRFIDNGPTSSTKGYCSGSCPNCSHNGNYGGDCSGLVAKAWKVPSNNIDLSNDEHPYGTAEFAHDTSKWYTVSRNKVLSGDAFVYRSGTHGHIMIYASGDAWGSAEVYECRGCNDGCVHHTRTISVAYHAIRRSGI